MTTSTLPLFAAAIGLSLLVIGVVAGGVREMRRSREERARRAPPAPTADDQIELRRPSRANGNGLGPAGGPLPAVNGNGHGADGEGIVRRALAGLDQRAYQGFHELYLEVTPDPNGPGTTAETTTAFTPIDHVVASRYGIFVVTAEHRSGAVTGGPNDRTWTYIRPSGRGQAPLIDEADNPLRQTSTRSKMLAERLGLGPGQVRPLVVMMGGAHPDEGEYLGSEVLFGSDALVERIEMFNTVVLDENLLDASVRELTRLDADHHRSMAKAIHASQVGLRSSA